jgi:hypothetical protein
MRIKTEQVSSDPGSGRAKKGDGSHIDSRVVEYEPEMVPSPAVDDEKCSDTGSQGVPLLLEDMDQDQFLLDQDVIDVDADLRQTLNKEPKVKDKTRFVVTLDGVDEDQYQLMEVSEGSERMEEELGAVSASRALPVSQAGKVAPPITSLSRSGSQQSLPQASTPVLRSPPKIQAVNISLKDSDDEGEGAMETEDITPLKVWKQCCLFLGILILVQ